MRIQNFNKSESLYHNVYTKINLHRFYALKSKKYICHFVSAMQVCSWDVWWNLIGLYVKQPWQKALITGQWVPAECSGNTHMNSILPGSVCEVDPLVVHPCDAGGGAML